MTSQTAVHSQSTLGPPTFPPLLLSSSKGFRDKRGERAGVCWNGWCLPLAHKKQAFSGACRGFFLRWRNGTDSEQWLFNHQIHFSWNELFPLCLVNPLQSLASISGHQRGLTVDWRWNVKNLRSDRCGFPEEKP